MLPRRKRASQPHVEDQSRFSGHGNEELAQSVGVTYSSRTSLSQWGSVSRNMHRLTARFLLLFALAGNLAPVALAASRSAQPQHACCVRKGIHHCHDSATADSAAPAIHSTDCCANHDCCRVSTVARWAYLTAPTALLVSRFAEPFVAAPQIDSANPILVASVPIRAPPHSPIV